MGMAVLDLDCPFPWPGRPGRTEELDGHKEEEEGEAWLQRRYAETLWLGEYHSPLSAFLQQLAHIVHQRGPSKSHGSLVRMLKTRSDIRKKFHEELRSADVLLETLHNRKNGILFIDEEHSADFEKEAIRHALASGPAVSVAKELSLQSDQIGASSSSSPAQQQLGKLTKRWLDAIEARELQMQMLLILYLLWLSAEYPSLASASLQKASMTGSSAPTTPSNEMGLAVQSKEILSNESSQDERRDADRRDSKVDKVEEKGEEGLQGDKAEKRKRKRKSQVARRWNGSLMSGFPWGGGSSNNSSLSKDSMAVNALEDLGTEPETLNRRFEALVDTICLCVVTSSLSFDGPTSSLSSATPPSASKSSPRRPGMAANIPQFGSRGRKKTLRDERDEVQWLCSDVVEPFFSEKLPRQCRLMRSKCFVAGSGSTPARPVRASTMSAPAIPTAVEGSGSHKRKTAEPVVETDLVKRHREREAAQQAQQMARERQRLGLVEAWEKEQRQRGDAKTVTARNTASRAIQRLDAREVSVRRRWERATTEDAASASASGRWARSTSVPNLLAAMSGGAAANGQGADPRQSSGPSKRKPLAAKRTSTVSLNPAFSSSDDDDDDTKDDNQPQSQTLVMATPQKARKTSMPSLSSLFGSRSMPFSSTSSSIPSFASPIVGGDDGKEEDDDDGERVLPELLAGAKKSEEEGNNRTRPSAADDWKRKIEAMRLRETNVANASSAMNGPTTGTILGAKRPFSRSESQPVVTLHGHASLGIGSGSGIGADQPAEEDDEEEEMIVSKRRRGPMGAQGRSAAALLSFGNSSSRAPANAAAATALPPALPTGRNPFAAHASTASPAELGRAWRGAQPEE